MKKKKHGDEEHENQERWLLTYADLITLLLGLFVILYAMSKIDAGKYAEIAAALGGVFGSSAGKMPVTQGSHGVIQVPIPIIPQERKELQKEVEAALQQNLKSGLITLSTNERGLTVHVAEELGFASGSADPKADMFLVLDTLVAIFRRLPHDIRVEGHTDDVPINTPVFRSNWHLSVARAVNVAYYMVDEGLNPEKLSVAGYGEFHPLVPNTSESNRAKNRRVDIVIINSVESHSPVLADTTAIIGTISGGISHDGESKIDRNSVQ